MTTKEKSCASDFQVVVSFLTSWMMWAPSAFTGLFQTHRPGDKLVRISERTIDCIPSEEG